MGDSKASFQPHYYTCISPVALDFMLKKLSWPHLVVGQSEGQIPYFMKSDNFLLPSAGLIVGEVFK